MKIKTSELSGAQLNWAVVKSDGVENMAFVWPRITGYTPSTNWAQGGPIIERDNISIEYMAGAGDAGADVWVATRVESSSISEEQGDTPLVAAMRCYVASKLGEEVEVPDAIA